MKHSLIYLLSSWALGFVHKDYESDVNTLQHKPLPCAFKSHCLMDVYMILMKQTMKNYSSSQLFHNLLNLDRVVNVTLINWDRVTHICTSKLTTISSDNSSPVTWTVTSHAGILLIGRLGTNFSEILIVIKTFQFKKIHLNMSSAKWHPSCFGGNVLNRTGGIRKSALIYGISGPLWGESTGWHHCHCALKQEWN